MSDFQVPHAKRYGAISAGLSLVSYAIVIFLYTFCMWVFVRTPSTATKKMRFLLPIIATAVFLISTCALVSGLLLDFAFPLAFFSSLPNSTKGDSCSSCLCGSLKNMQNCFVVLAIWAADGFMIWKCTVLYYDLSGFRRIAFLTSCWLLAIASLVIGIVYAIPSTRNHITLTFFSCITLIINVLRTALIVGRLISHHKFLKMTGDDSPYVRIMAICIKSALVMVIFNIVFVVFSFLQSSWSLVLLQMLVQVYVITPLMILFRIAYDRNRAYRAESGINTSVKFSNSKTSTAFTPSSRKSGFTSVDFSKSWTDLDTPFTPSTRIADLSWDCPPLTVKTDISPFGSFGDP
ncbi:hypothetical protein CPC08DRAFT_707746 [Agrocybe pediades]|nr:hypothetical protein CPC08DRAFT_707746 [Agrocybe pediades]